MKWFPCVAVISAAFSGVLVPLHADTIYVVDNANSAVLQVTPGGAVSTFLQDAVHFEHLDDITFGPDGTLFAEGFTASTFRPFVNRRAPDGTWATLLFDFALQGIASDAHGNVVIRERTSPAGFDDAFLRYDAVSQLISPFGETTPRLPAGSATSTMDGIGNFYFNLGGNVRKTTPGGTTTSIIGDSSSSGRFALHLAADVTGNLYADMLVDSVRGIYRVDQSGDTALIAPGVFGFMTTDTFGNIYVNQSGTLQEVTPDGVVNTIATGLPNAPIAAIVPEPASGLLLGMSAALVFSGTRRRSRNVRR